MSLMGYSLPTMRQPTAMTPSLMNPSTPNVGTYTQQAQALGNYHPFTGFGSPTPPPMPPGVLSASSGSSLSSIAPYLGLLGLSALGSNGMLGSGIQGLLGTLGKAMGGSGSSSGGGDTSAPGEGYNNGSGIIDPSTGLPADPMANPGYGTDTGIPNWFDPGTGSGPSAAGGEAATGTSPGLLSNLSGAAGIAGGLASGTPTGYAGAGLSATQLAAKNGLLGSGSGTLGQAAGLGGNLLGVYSGLQQGGAAGYGGAALSGLSAANQADNLATGSGFLSSGAGSALGGAGDILGIYNGIRQGGVGGYGSAALNAYNLYNTVSPLISSAGSGAADAASPALGAVAGGAAAIAAPLATAYMGASSAPINFSPEYWTQVQQGLSGNSPIDQQLMAENIHSPIPQAQQQANYATQAQEQLLNQYIGNNLEGWDTSDIGGNSGFQIPASVLAAYPGGASGFYAAANSLLKANQAYGSQGGGTGGGTGGLLNNGQKA